MSPEINIIELSVVLTPGAQLYLIDGPPESVVEEDAGKRIKAAFTVGEGEGLLHLGAVEVKTALPPSMYQSGFNVRSSEPRSLSISPLERPARSYPTRSLLRFHVPSTAPSTEITGMMRDNWYMVL